MKKSIKKVLWIALAFIMVLGAAMPQVTVPVFAAQLAKDLAYEHSGGADEPKWITEEDGDRHWVFCINPNINARSVPGPWPFNKASDRRNKYTGDTIGGALKYNTEADASQRMTGTQWDQDFLASIVIYGIEQGYSYVEIQDAVKDAVYNRDHKSGMTGLGAPNALYEYALSNMLGAGEYELYVYGDEHPDEFQTVIYAVRVKTVTINTQAGTDKSGATKSDDGATLITIPEGESKTGLGTVWDVISYEDLKANQSYAITVSLKDTNGNVLRERENAAVSTGDSTSGTWDMNALGLQMWPDPVGEGTYYFDVTVYEVNGDDYKKIGSHSGADDPKEQFRVSGGTTEEPPEEPPVEEKKGELSTTVEVNGSKGSETAEAEVKVPAGEKSIAVDVKDTIDYKNLVKGNTYKVQGTLMEVAEDGTTTEVAKSDAEEKVAEEENGTWEIVFKNVTLEVGKKYVVFESATPIKDAENNEITDGKVIEHNDPKDKAQTVVVTEEEPTEPEEPKEEEPEKPTEPEEPKEEEPEKPTEPEEPKEEEPEKPTEPEEPKEEEPEKPTEPEEPKEEVPNLPSTPGENPPEVPSTGRPEQPQNNTPSTPQTPPQVPSTGNPPAAPNTGDTNNIMLWVLLGAAAAFVATLSLRIRIKR